MRGGVVAAGVLITLCGLPARAQDTPAATSPASPAPAAAPDPGEAPAAPPPAPPSTTRWELAAGGGYMSAPIPGALTPLGPGVGGRLGVDISGVYLGGASTYYFGGSDSGATESTLLFGGELGYSIRVSTDFTLRPLVGLGGAMISHSEPLTSTSGTTSGGRGGRGGVDVVSSASGGSSNTTRVTSLYVKPGLVALFGIGSDFFLGFGTDVLYVPKVTYTDGSVASWLSYGVNGQIGKRF
jgi:hypothetical protein